MLRFTRGFSFTVVGVVNILATFDKTIKLDWSPFTWEMTMSL